MSNDSTELPLFHGPHIPRFRCERALDALDLAAALKDAPEEWRDTIAHLAAALNPLGRPSGAALDRLRQCRREAWPPILERTWQRLVGRCLDSHGIPQTLDGEPAAAFLLRGGECQRARRSIRRHLKRHPRDARGWAVLAEIDPVLGAARCAFHDGPVLECAGPALDLVIEDELEPRGPWLLPYAWFAGNIALADVAQALEAEGLLAAPPLPVPGDARAFAWYLLDAGGRSFAPKSVGVIEARTRLQRISPVAFRRYLAKVDGDTRADRRR